MLGLWMKFIHIHWLQGRRDSPACDGMLVSPAPGLTRQHSASPADGFIASLNGTFPLQGPREQRIFVTTGGSWHRHSLGQRDGLETVVAHDV